MKVLLIGPLPLPVNGCSLANEVLLKGLTSKKDISVIVIDTNTDNISSQKVGVFSFKKVFSFFRSYRKILLIRKAEVIYTTPGQTFFGIAKYAPFYLLSILLSKPYIIHVHGNHLGNEFNSLVGLKKSIFRWLIKNAKAGIVLSDSLRSNFKSLLPPDKIFSVENFAQDNLFFDPIVNKPADTLRVLYLSNLMKEKGISDLLDALLMLKSAGIDFQANIAGKKEDEGSEEITSKMNQLNGQLKYHGPVHGSQKVELLLNSNVFVLPTYYRMEGQPISLLEAMATGNLILTTRYSGIPDVVTEKNGYFVEEKSPNSIFNKLREISQNLHEQVNNFALANRNHAKENFTETLYTQKVIQVLEFAKNAEK